jgi:hypothetical protein
MTPQIEALVQSTLVDLDNDDCDLDWILSNRVREASPGASYDLLRQITLQVVTELIGRGYAKPHPLGETYENANPDEPVLEQTRHGWDRCGERLSMGDVAYLSITPAGRTAARSAPSHS